jgi:nicotinamidase-related amidase
MPMIDEKLNNPEEHKALRFPRPIIITLILLFTALALSGCTALPTIRQSEHSAQALVLIDLQRGVLSPDGPATLGNKRSDALIQATDRAIDTALKNGIPIAFVKNEWSQWRFFENWWFGGAFKKGSEWAQVDPRLLTRIPEDKRVVFSKPFPSAFSDPNLQKWLESNKVGKLIVGGLYGDKCITSTTMEALERGYIVQLVPDGIVTQDEEGRAPTIEKLINRGATIWTPALRGNP